MIILCKKIEIISHKKTYENNFSKDFHSQNPNF